MKKIKILIGSLLIATLMTGCASKKTNDRNGSRRIPTSF